MTTQPDKLKIGQLVRNLQREFPDISVSKIRYFEEQGLLTPARDQSGYRRYSSKDVEVLKWILETQRDQYLPLEVIADKLRNGEFKRQAKKTPPVDKRFIEDKAFRENLNERELIKFSGISIEQLENLKDIGFVGVGPTYNEDDLRIALASRVMLVHGMEVRHLKPFRRAAERESDLVMQVISPQLHKTEEDKAYLLLDELVKAGRDLYEAILRRELRINIDEIGHQ